MRIHLPAYEYDDANDDEHCMEIMYACRFLFDSCLSVCLFRLEWMEEKEHKDALFLKRAGDSFVLPVLFR